MSDTLAITLVNIYVIDVLFKFKQLYGIHVPLRETLKLFLEIPGMFN